LAATGPLGALWVFFLEKREFVAGQQEYGVFAVAAWDAGHPEAERACAVRRRPDRPPGRPRLAGPLRATGAGLGVPGLDRRRARLLVLVITRVDERLAVVGDGGDGAPAYLASGA